MLPDYFRLLRYVIRMLAAATLIFSILQVIDADAYAA